MLLTLPSLAPVADVTLGRIFDILGQGGAPRPDETVPGIYTIRHFNGDMHLPGGQLQWHRYDMPPVPRKAKAHADLQWRLDELTYGGAISGEDDTMPEYGVCDSAQNLLDVWGTYDDPVREYVVFLTEVVRAEQPPRDGWRWHKWGPYIGAHDPKHEYLFHETIDRVYVYHIYERRAEWRGTPLGR